MDIQNNIIEAIQILAGNSLSNISFTKSFSGRVNKIDKKSCTVEAYGEEYECIIPSNLVGHIITNDVVIVQDLYNNNSRRLIQGVISSQEDSVKFHIYDPVENVVISNILQLWDEELGEEVFGIEFEVE